MRVVSLFTGCGGLDLGLHQAGHEVIMQCECDPGAQQVLRKTFPGVLLVPDICGLQRLPKDTDLVAAGFPCIDVSRAGLRQGLDGPSTGLVRHVFRLLAAARDDNRPVPWVLLENVEALLDRHHGGLPAVSWVVQQLEDLGYRSWAHRVICSAGFGIPNRRKRIIILASMHGDARDVLLGQGLHRCMGGCLACTGGDCWECFDPDDDPNTGSKSEAAMLRCSYALDLGNARSAAGVDVVPTFTTSNARICLLLSNGRYGGLRIEDAERLQGFPVGHTAAAWPLATPGIRQHRQGAAPRECDAETQARARFALLGNAVTVQVARWIGERLADPYSYKYMVTDNDMPLGKQLQTSSMPDSTWARLREVRLDRRLCQGAAGGQAKLVSRGRQNWEAATAAGSDSDRDAQEQDAQEEEQLSDQMTEEHSEGADDTSMSDGAREGQAAAGAAATNTAARRRYTPGRVSSTAWPRAAWYLAGSGRWGLAAASDAPVKARFVPLGEFIRRVGPPPPDVALVTYLQRLKEQGWNVDRTERKMLMCGVAAAGAGPAATASGLLAGGNSCALQSILTGAQATDVADSAASSIGRLVWAIYQTRNRTSGGGSSTRDSTVYWPCEAIDPFNPPRGFTLTAQHRLALPEHERRIHLPQAGGHGDGQKQQLGGTSAEARHAAHIIAAPADPAVRESLASAGSGRGSPSLCSSAVKATMSPIDAAASFGGSSDLGSRTGSSEPAADGGGSISDRKLLLIWFHSNEFEWREESKLLPFEQHKARLKGEALALTKSGKLTRPQDWKRAYREAKHCATIMARAAKMQQRQQQLTAVAGPAAAAQLVAAEVAGGSSSDGSGSSSDSDIEHGRGHRAAVTGRAAKQALAVNIKMPRCRVCESCTQSTGGSINRRCLLVRATAAAASGHGGAQLAVLGDKAIGAEIQVWWPLDQAWYKGVVTAYDSLRVRHTVTYEDSDVEIIPLWAPQQRIKLCSQPGHWVAKRAQLEAQREAARRDMEAARAAARVAGAGGLPSDTPAGPATPLELERAGNIQRNTQAMQQFLSTADVASTAAAFMSTPTSAAVGSAVGSSKPVKTIRAGQRAGQAAVQRATEAGQATPAGTKKGRNNTGAQQPRAVKRARMQATGKRRKHMQLQPGSAAAAAQALQGIDATVNRLADRGVPLAHSGAGKGLSGGCSVAAAAATEGGSGNSTATAADILAAAAAAGTGKRGSKRHAACLAGARIKDQMVVLKQVSKPVKASKKRKQEPAAAPAISAEAKVLHDPAVATDWQSAHSNDDAGLDQPTLCTD